MAASLAVQEMILLPPGELAERLRSDPPDDPGELIHAFREEASRFYHTDAAEARRIAERAVEAAGLLDNAVAAGWARRAMAESLLFSGNIKESEKWYARAADAWRSARREDLLGQLLAGRIHVLALLGRFADAEAAAAEARRHLGRSRDIAFLARVSMNLATMYFQRDMYVEFLRECDSAARLFRKLGVRDHAVIGTEVNRAVALTQLDRHEEALSRFAELERECDAKGFGLLLAQVRMNAAYVHFLRGEFDRALTMLASATSYFRDTNHPAFTAACLLNRAEIYHQLNLHAEAMALADEAIPLFAAEGMRYDEALAVYQKALSAVATGDVGPASRSIRRALRLFDREKNPARAALMKLLWAEALWRRRRAEEARARASEAAAAFRDLGLVRWEALAAVLLARIRIQTGARGGPAPALQDLLKRFPQRVYPLTAYRVIETIGEELEAAGHSSKAEAAFRRAIGKCEEMRVQIPSEDSKISFLRDKTHLYDRLIAIELRKRRPSVDRLFELMERSRSQQMWDRFRAPAVLGEGKEQERARRQLSWLHARISSLEMGSTAERARASALRRDLSAAEAEWRRVIRETSEARRTGGRAVAAVPGPTAGEVLSPQDVARGLPKGWGLLSYHVGPDFAIAVAITREGAVWRPLAPDLDHRLSLLTERLSFQWGAAALACAAGDLASSRPLVSSTESVLRDLHALLWKPIEEMVGSADLRWIVSPHGPIHRIPLHALLGEKGYVIDGTDLAVVPSARIWRRTPRPGRGRDAWIAGVPSPELPAVRVEVDRVAGRLRDAKVTRDLQPTVAAFREHAPRSRWIHLATHGSARSDNPAYSSIALADGPLFAYDLATVRLPGSVVVLSGCSTGEAERLAGDEWVGLGRSFLQAGASAVVMSLWSIDDQATCDLMDGFYESLDSPTGAPGALGRAMRDVRATRPHPWQWGSFAVLGGVGALT